MVACDICKAKIQKTWNYCPECGAKTKADEYSFIKLNYIWERDISGQFIYDNFGEVKETVNFASDKPDPYRKKLGKFVHINFYNLRKFELLSFSPKFALEIFKIGKLTGYYDAELAARSANMRSRVEELSKTEKFIDIIREIDNWATLGYTNLGCGVLKLKEVNEKKKRIVYTLDENTNYSVKSNKKICYEDLGVFCGWGEGTTGRFFNGIETKCHCIGDSICEFEMYPTKTEEEPQLELLTTDEAKEILNALIDDLVNRRSIVNRKTLGDYTYIAFEQVMNYLLTYSTKGHEALTKYCGTQVGGKIAGKAKLKGESESVVYLKDLFEFMRVGIVESETNKDSTTIKMHESVYSSGVANINMKLDTFIAGIIEGALNQATDQRWHVEETKCIANGDNHCEFKCKRI